LAASHIPVLADAVVEYLVHDVAGIYVDGTVNGGGHSLAIASRLEGDGRLICLDRDPDALNLAGKRLAIVADRVHVMKGNYADLDEIMESWKLPLLDGVVLDLGMSSNQLDTSGRGFSFQRDEPLDMRMDPDDSIQARDLVNGLPEKELEQILRLYGEEKRAKAIARAIGRRREEGSIESSAELARLVQEVYPRRSWGKRHPATRTFQALRIAVNRELDNLQTFLRKIPGLMGRGGRLVILSYHSLEDRLVKKTFVEWEKQCTCPPDLPQCVCGKTMLFRRLFVKGVRPGAQEIQKNPHARSAIMRAVARV
jgi:16S rRNA (cytosine1402-N4)-methyltransferase